jgi:TfoX/Sxy family transcriptional regulator of competence genes
MASDPKLVGRLSSILAGRSGIEQRKMFGGVAYLLNGNMCVGVHNDWLIARAGELGAAPLLERCSRPADGHHG